MHTKFIAISDMFRPFTSYHGDTSFDWIEEQSLEFFLEGQTPPHDWCLELDYSFLEEMRKECADVFLMNWKKCFEPKFEKYGYSAQDSQWYVPRAYNFEHDSLDLKFDFSGCHKDNIKALEKELVKYIESVREKSSDGYMSLEPDEIKNIDYGDYCIFWAIAEKEGIKKDLQEFFDDLIFEDFQEIAYSYYGEAIFKELKSQPFYKEKSEAQTALC
jgi:hypothetical protein